MGTLVIVIIVIIVLGTGLLLGGFGIYITVGDAKEKRALKRRQQALRQERLKAAEQRSHAE